MYRDFSDRSKNELLGLVSEVENEKLSNFTDWVGDRWYDFESWIGKLNIKNYLNNVNEYHKKVIDKNNATQSSINTIFRKVKSVDTSYKNTLSGKKSQLQQWQRYIDEMSEIVNPRNGKFNAKAMSDALDGLLRQLAMDELNSSLEEYVELDKTTQKYTYHWNEIEELFTKDTYSMTDTDYQVLLFVLSTMVGENGQITDVENLQKFINAGYTTPSSVTANDYHTSFETLPNGQKMSYYYIQNKSYMSDTLKVICAKYSEMCEVSNDDDALNALMKSIVENYSVIEWRQKLDYTNAIAFTQMSFDGWSGEISISEETLNKFNTMCKPSISLEYVDTKGSMDYFVIKSNATNLGNVRTANSDGQVVQRNDVATDNYSDCTIRLYWGCKNTDLKYLEGLNIYAQSVIAGYYEEFDTGEVFTDEIVNIASSIPVAGKFVKSIYDIGTQTEVIGAVSSGLDGIKSTDLGEFSNVSKKTESKIDAGIGIINRGIGIYTKYKAVEVNNEQVADKQNAVDEMANNFEDMMNRGLTYNTMTIKYDHCEYVEDGTGIKVDGSKNCDIVSNVDISISDIEPDIRTLEKQYNYHRGTKISKEDEYHSKNEDGQIVINEIGLAELEKQMTNYIETGSVEENSILAYYLKEIIE